MTARPHTLQISPSSSNASFEDTDETYSQDLEQESESINGNLTGEYIYIYIYNILTFHNQVIFMHQPCNVWQ